MQHCHVKVNAPRLCVWLRNLQSFLTQRLLTNSQCFNERLPLLWASTITHHALWDASVSTHLLSAYLRSSAGSYSPVNGSYRIKITSSLNPGSAGSRAGPLEHRGSLFQTQKERKQWFFFKAWQAFDMEMENGNFFFFEWVIMCLYGPRQLVVCTVCLIKARVTITQYKNDTYISSSFFKTCFHHGAHGAWNIFNVQPWLRAEYYTEYSKSWRGSSI